MFRKTKGGGFGKANGNADKTSTEGTRAMGLDLGNGEKVPGNDFQENLQLCCPDETLIYSAPTVDTLGDEESLSRLYHSPRQAHENALRNDAAKNANRNKNHAKAKANTNRIDPSSLPPNTTPLMREDLVMLPTLSGSRPTSSRASDARFLAKGIIQKSASSSSESVSSKNRSKPKMKRKKRNLIQQQQDVEKERRRLQQQQIQKLNQRRRRRLVNNAGGSIREFQLDEDKMSVTIRRIPVAERTAFDKKVPPYFDGSGSGGRILASNSSTSLGSIASSSKKVSPSWQHWCALQQLSSVTHLRQLAFSNSVGSAVDVFWREEDDEEEEEEITKGEGKNKSKPRNRDGRYRSINPVKATMEALPKAPPLLSNNKHRLPMRSDVGFPGASMKEITRKQFEIRNETEWEEASPRLVVLVTGDDLGTAVQEEDDYFSDEINLKKNVIENDDAKNRSKRTTRQGLPGMPWAGQNLIQAKERNNRHFSRRQESSSASHKDEGAEKVTNMLAPPLDATYSGTLGWRPRLFHDRPPGMRYTLVCPMSVNFSVGNMEPLVCSMALYSLQKGKISEEFYFPAGDWEGKLQLDALRERLQSSNNENISKNNNPSDVEEETNLLLQLWNKRKHKAIFAHNSWVFDDDEKGNSDRGDQRNINKLYIVLQVHKVTHADSISAYWSKEDMNNTKNAYRKFDKKTWKKKLKNKFQNSSKKSKSTGRDGDTDADLTDVEKALLRSNAIFDSYGTQFTSPLCFGITSLFPEDSDYTSRYNKWPRGQVQQNMDLHLSPGHSESQEDFLRRLRKVVASSSLPVVSDPSLVSEEASENSIVEEEQSVTSAAPSHVSSTSTLLSPSKKKRSVRRLRTPKRMSKRNMMVKSAEATPIIPGSVTLFTSNLDVDFLQSMLTTPPELIDKVSIKRTKGNENEPKEVVLPRILVDASGDSAIMVDPKKTVNSAKRSDLVRLPSIRLAEHLDSSEFREVMFLHPEAGRIFGLSDHRSLLNLLYVYPKLLVLKSDESGTNNISSKVNKHQHRYTIRARLVQNISSTTADGIIENRNEIVSSFHNPASWGGSNLLQSVFTRVPRDRDDAASPKRHLQHFDDPVLGIPLRDEFKMKLPTILDGSYFLQFSLFMLELNDYMDESTSYDSSSSGSSVADDCGIILRPLAETSIPLSSSSTRDPKSGIKATTVIPSGCHRLKLGNFQLQVETRLVSSIHVSDPTVAAALRDFPIASTDGQLSGHKAHTEGFDEMAISSRHSTVGRSIASRGADKLPVKISYPKLMESASASAVANHFQSLFLLHLRNLIKSGPSGGMDIDASERFIVDNMLSLLVLFERVKTFFLSRGRDFDRHRLSIFVKATIDYFDELSFHLTLQGCDNNEDDVASEYHTSDPRHSALESVNEDHDEPFDGGAIRRRTSDIGIRLTRTYSTMEAVPEARLSRIAYGASKNDHMRLEAELVGDRGRISTLFDDDETVATLSTLRSARNTPNNNAASESQSQQVVEARHAFEIETNDKKEAGNNDNMTASSISLSGGEKPKDSRDINMPDMAAFKESISELDIGKRVKSAAQVMLAPCVTVAPGLAAFVCKTSPRNTTVPLDGNASKENSSNSFSNKSSGSNVELLEDEEDLLDQVSLPGSDLDEDDAVVTSGADASLSPYCIPEGLFRGTGNHSIRFEFSIRQYGSVHGRRAPVVRGTYVYESIMTLWLKAWSDYVTGLGQNSEKNSSGIAINFLGKAEEGNSFSKFYLQMDILLPMVLKSIGLRYGEAVKDSKQKGVRCILDKDHVYVFESFIEMLAIGLMGQAMTELQENTKHGTLADAVDACEFIADFMIGLFAIFHPAHMESLICKFVTTLRMCESDKNDSFEDKSPLKWNKATLHRTKCSRQLRLRTVEKLAVLPNFVALNFPQRYSTKHFSVRTEKSTWLAQCESGKAPDASSKRATSKDSSITDGLLPRTGWLASLLTNESLSICALSCDTVVSEAIASIETQESKNNDKTPQRSSRSIQPSLRRPDLLMFQSIAIHAISCVYELLLRRHAMDRRFQTESSRGRIAALFTKSIFEKSLASVRWLSRMDSTHRVRSIWMLCFVYILQEAPENLIREHIRSYSDPSDLNIHRFIRLLRLGSTTFQSFIDQQRHCMFPLEIDRGISPWLLQESFNTVCATTILVVEESVTPTSSIPNEQRKMIQGILDLLLHVLTTPQSTVTHLRAVGGAIQAFEKFGTLMFLETTGDNFQHWIRVVLGLMNSTALSVRSIAVDFVVSLLCGVFDLQGNIEDVALIFATVLPEVVAREIALCSINGLINSFEDAEKSIWPLRRSFADIEDANPLDDDRVDPQLAPVLSVFGRASQAIIDGVLVEMRLRGENCVVVGNRITTKNKDKYIFDADEESLFEAANFFTPEASPMQRLRWLLTLKSLHVSKEHWVEAAETLITCARTLSDAIPHLITVWRPSRFSLWSDNRRSLWLSTVGEEIGNSDQGNAQVMTFANSFLEPEGMVSSDEKQQKINLCRPTLSDMSSLLMSISKEAIAMYSREGGMDITAYTQLESLLRIVLDVLDDHEYASGAGVNDVLQQKQFVEEMTCLRKIIASITADMTNLAESLLLVASDEPTSLETSKISDEKNPTSEDCPYYVRLLLSGKKPRRFEESTSLPTFIEWDKPCICRVPKKLIQQAIKSKEKNSNLSETAICNAYGNSIRNALLQDLDATEIVFCTGTHELDVTNEEKTYVKIDIVRAECMGSTKRGLHDGFGYNYRRFLYSKTMNPDQGVAMSYVQMTVAKAFPCPLSRQRSMHTNEFVSSE